MEFDRIVRSLDALNLNLYEFARFTPQGIQSHRFQPCSNCHNSYSVAKLFIVTALGMLWDEGKIRMDDPLRRFFDLPPQADARLAGATVEHAVTPRLGFGEGFLDIDTEDTALYPTQDYLSIVLSHPLAHAPGTHEQYSDAAYYLLSRLISRAAGENADALLNRRLLLPLRFREAAWSRCPMEYPIGATGLYISSADAVKLGALYLCGGELGGRRYLSQAWCAMALERGYELHPLFPDDPGNDLTGKWGMYGQLVAFSKSRGFAIALHAHINRKQKEALLACLRRL